MCLLYIDPDNALAIKQMMDEWVNCRLLLGAHWNTDIAAGKTLGAIAFAIAMNYDQFRDLVIAAKNELAAYRARQIPTGTNQSAKIPDLSDKKQLVNGQLYIIRDGVTYTAQGATVMME